MIWNLFEVPIRLFLRNKLILLNLIISGILNLASWFLLYLKIAQGAGPEQLVFLHYNIYFGIDWSGVYWKIFVIPFIGILILAGNFFISFVIYRRERLASIFLASGTTLIQFFLLLATIAIIFINL